MSMRRWYFFFAALISCLFVLFFLVAQPTTAQPPSEALLQEGDPTSTPPPGTPTVDWANVQMGGDEGGYFPHVSPEAGTPGAPSPEAPVPPEPGEGTPPPPPPPDPAATPAPSAITHVVQAGETLYEIALRFGVTLDELIAANNIHDPRRLNIGQVLVIPRPGDAGSAVVATPEEGAAEANAGTYVVRYGDTLYQIARRFDVNLAALTAANQISDPRQLKAGQVLTIPGRGNSPPAAATPAPAVAVPPPAGEARAYVVQRGDTLFKIATRFGVSMRALIEANSLTNPDRIMAGRTLSIPGASGAGAPDTQAPDPVPTQIPVAATPTSPPPADGQFIWPIPLQDGWIPRWYYSGHPGIDIILPLETPIHAAAGGTIEFSGWNAYGFGNLVVIDHGNGYRTLYAHQSERLVATGDVVGQGDVIGLVGSTGRSTHPHLHFEIRQGYVPVNPCDYLPGGCQ